MQTGGSRRRCKRPPCLGKGGGGAMPLHPGPLLSLVAALVTFLPGGFCGSPSHSLSYFYLQLPVPSQGLPPSFLEFYLDDQPIARFDSLTRKMEPLVPWMEEVENETFLPFEWVFRANLEKLSKLDRRTGGLHIWQVNLGCELWEDGGKAGFLHYGYDGMDFISFDKVTLRWVTAQHQAQKVKEEWEEDPGWSKTNKIFLDKTCIEALQRYLSYKNKTLQRREPPVGKVTSKVVNERLEVLICQAFGFYPREIWTTWTRDGEVCEYETLHRNVVPNSDGTYYVLLSIEIDPKERDLFWCRLEHEGLQEPLMLSFKEETATEQPIPVGTVVCVISGAVIFFLMGSFWRCRMSPYQKAKSSVDDFPSEILSSSLNCGTDNKIQSELMLQSEVTSEDRVSYGEWSPQRVLEDSGSTLLRLEGKLDDFPSEILSSSLNSGIDNEIQSEAMLQSEEIWEDMESCGERSPQRVLEDSGSTLRRQKGKKKPQRRSKTWMGKLRTLDKAEATKSKEGSKAEKVTVRSVRRKRHTVPIQYPRGKEGY